MERDGDGLRATRTLRTGQSWGVILESDGGAPKRVHSDDIHRLLTDTVAFWRTWLRGSTYRGRWRDMVARSAMTLKLMQYAPTGGLVAAPDRGAARAGRRRAELGLPVHLDQGRLVLHLRACSASASPTRRGRSPTWLRDRAAEQAGDASGPLKIMYRVDGSSDLTEEILDHFEGWRGSRPVRIGNGAADQLQLDIYGEAMDAMSLADQRRRADRPPELAGDRQLHRLAVRALGPARRGHLGDPRRPQELRLRHGSRPGSRSTARSRWRTNRGPPGRPARAGGPSGTRSTTRSSSRAGTRRSAASPSSTAARCSTPRC